MDRETYRGDDSGNEDFERERTSERRRRDRGRETVVKKKSRAGRIFGTIFLILFILAAIAGILWLLADQFSDELAQYLPFLGKSSQQTIEEAQELADRYDYDGAIARLQSHTKYNSELQLQEKVQEYEAARSAMEQEIEQLLFSAEEYAWEFDYQDAADHLKASPYYEYNTLLQSKAAEYEEALRTVGEAEKATLLEADRLAAMYDYDAAITMLQGMNDYENNPALRARIASYEEKRASCVAINPEDVTHIFYHSLVVDPSLAFRQDDPDYAGWQQWMTTISEFDKITQSMYEKGYVLVSIHDLINKTTDENGKVTITPNQIMLPPGKKAYVLSLDDLSYYHTYDNHGVASKVVLDEEGKPTCEYIAQDGTVSYGDYDAVPRLDTFLEEHPDGCYRGARGIIALTGYNGILGYRTDGAYSAQHNTNSETYYTDDLQSAWLANHPDYSWEEDCAQAKAVADAMKAEGWEFASHTWGHKAVGEIEYDKLVADTERWMEYVSPLIGETDVIIFAHGQDLASGGYDSSNEKYKYLKSQGFDIYCNVDSVAYTTSVTSEYLHQGRRNLDGYRIYYDAIAEEGESMTADLFDAAQVLDPERPTPVPPLQSEEDTGSEEDADSEEDAELE